MSLIDIGTVLNKFDDTYDEENVSVKEYGIRFITADGRCRRMRCRKGVKAPKVQLKEGNQERGKFRYNLQRNGTLLLHDLDINEPRAPKVPMIFSFKDHQSESWVNVFH